MSGLSDARAELAAAIAPTLRVFSEPTGTFATPCARVHPASPWLAPSSLAKGRRTQRYEIWVVLGRMDSAANFKAMEDAVSGITNALDVLPGWSAVIWDRPGPTDMGGNLYLAVRGLIETNKEV